MFMLKWGGTAIAINSTVVYTPIYAMLCHTYTHSPLLPRNDWGDWQMQEEYEQQQHIYSIYTDDHENIL